MPVKHTTWLALIAVFAIVGPFCGAVAAVACAGDCCCGHSNLSSSCAEGACLMSQPVAAQHSAIQSHEMRTDSMVDRVDAVEVLTAGVSAQPAALIHLQEYSPPDILLSNQQLLI